MLHVNIILLLVDINYLAFRGQKYATLGCGLLVKGFDKHTFRPSYPFYGKDGQQTTYQIFLDFLDMIC